MASSPLLAVAEDLKKLLLGHVQSGGGDEAEFTRLRRQLLAERRLDSLIPDFLAGC